jgi:hypothetical protein
MSSRPDIPHSPVAHLDAAPDYEGAGQAALAGCSPGGAIIIEYALAHPAPITGLARLRPGARHDTGRRSTRPARRTRTTGRSALGHLLPAA